MLPLRLDQHTTAHQGVEGQKDGNKRRRINLEPSQSTHVYTVVDLNTLGVISPSLLERKATCTCMYVSPPALHGQTLEQLGQSCVHCQGLAAADSEVETDAARLLKRRGEVIATSAGLQRAFGHRLLCIELRRRRTCLMAQPGVSLSSFCLNSKSPLHS